MCQMMGNMGKRQEMPRKPILKSRSFNLWVINFVGPFPSSNCNKYVLHVVDYISKWVEAISLPTSETKHVLKFLCKNIFARFGSPWAIISDKVFPFYNKLFANLMAKYGMTHKVANAYY